MQRRKRWAFGALLVVVVVGLVVPAMVAAGPDEGATVQFGNPDAGSPYPPPAFEGHDSSSNARDNLIPRTSVISAGGNVTFNVVGFHQPAVYEAGTTPDDIDVPPFPVPFNLFINDPDGRLALGAPVPGPWTPPAGTFDEPGRYLILCNVTPHFALFNQYGWVIVK
jgi:hypothetical protein